MTTCLDELARASAQTALAFGSALRWTVTLATDTGLTAVECDDGGSLYERIRTADPRQPDPGLLRELARLFGRRSDLAIIAAATPAEDFDLLTPDALTLAKVDQALASVGTAEDDPRFALLGWKQWQQLEQLSPEFAATPLLTHEDLPWIGLRARLWREALWLQTALLPSQAGVRRCCVYRRSALCYAWTQRLQLRQTGTTTVLQSAHRAWRAVPGAWAPLPCRD